MGIVRTLAECQLFIKIYDINLDNLMSYNEFLRATMTVENSALRIETS